MTPETSSTLSSHYNIGISNKKETKDSEKTSSQKPQNEGNKKIRTLVEENKPEEKKKTASKKPLPQKPLQIIRTCTKGKSQMPPTTPLTFHLSQEFVLCS